MLKGLFDKLPQDARPILHSDQGWQYQMKEFQRQLQEHNIIQSMSRKGNCLDNSVMENFFGRLKVEMFYGEKFQTVDEFVHCLKEYISLLEQRENFSHSKRNEPGTIPNSFTSKLIFNFVQILGFTSLSMNFFVAFLPPLRHFVTPLLKERLYRGNLDRPFCVFFNGRPMTATTVSICGTSRYCPYFRIYHICHLSVTS